MGNISNDLFEIADRLESIKRGMRQSTKSRKYLAKLARRAALHITEQEHYTRKSQGIETNIFIGYGYSPRWKDLKDFIQDGLSLPWDEFNRVSVAGITDITQQMLDDATVAFLIMTAEDILK